MISMGGAMKSGACSPTHRTRTAIRRVPVDRWASGGPLPRGALLQLPLHGPPGSAALVGERAPEPCRPAEVGRSGRRTLRWLRCRKRLVAPAANGRSAVRCCRCCRGCCPCVPLEAVLGRVWVLLLRASPVCDRGSASPRYGSGLDSRFAPALRRGRGRELGTFPV